MCLGTKCLNHNHVSKFMMNFAVCLYFRNQESVVKDIKRKRCEVLQEWIKPCENHLYWSATSTFSGNGKVIWAKFSSFLSHIVNKHSNIPDALFNKCFHGAIHPRKWLEVGKIMSVNP